MTFSCMKGLGIMAAIVLLTLSGCGGGDGGSTPTDEDTFTNGGVALTTSIATAATSKTVTVKDAAGATLLTLVATTTGITMSAPGQTDASMTFRQALTELPTDYTVRRMAVYTAGQMTASASASAMPDSPGCDWFPDSQCTLGCCAEHDQCYAANGCGASSWIWGFGSDACKNCNNIVYDCIAAACSGVTQSFLENNCYDGRCNKYYDCPPNYNACDCKDICADSGVTVPSSCGNGQCITGENLDNCWNDCGFGTSESVCCKNHDFPGETGSSCGAEGVSVCCCGYGFACSWHVDPASTQNQCVVSQD